MSELVPVSVSALLPLLILAAAAIAVLLHWRRRSTDGVVTIDEYSDAQKALETIIVYFPRARRIFDAGDMEFVSRSAAPDARRQFFRERKALAISWLSETRHRVASLMDLHLKLVGYTHDPAPKSELSLSARYLYFIVVCHFLVVLIWVGGPFRARKLLGYTFDAAEQFCFVFGSRLENINPARLTPGKAVSPRP
jgi:hypothetical protein